MSYRFDNFSSQSFERLSQSLCIPLLGKGVVVFGSGPDGAREATFEGEVDFPSPVDRWNGYIVVQAKCREKPKGGIQDARWLAGQIEKDLKKFADIDRNLRTPEYYLIFTNVDLSGVADTGGKAVVENVLSFYAESIGLKAYHVIAAEELCGILDNNPAIRTTYATWITPSDILSSVLKQLQRPNLLSLLPLALSRDIRNERDARLRDAGQETNKAIYLDQVFVDLPIESIDNYNKAYKGEPVRKDNTKLKLDNNENTEHLVGFISNGVGKQILERSADKFDPYIEQVELEQEAIVNRRNRIVVMGGPGQGKSTIGQFVAQIFRAKFLKIALGNSISRETRDIINPTLLKAEQEGIATEGPCRFPIRIDLPTFADTLKDYTENGKDLSVMKYISQILMKTLSIEISTSDVRELLTACPAIIIFDGLDEVPETSNRTEVIREIDALWDEVHMCSMDIVAIVTSRPQGYNEALSNLYWEHWEMAPLSNIDATKYATQLANVRLSDPDRRASILSELERAFTDPTTKLLSSSPLQVAILFGIANLKGAIPQDRWELFNRYYLLLRDREAQKPNQTSAIIRDYKREIDALHYECGFILQVSSEAAGGNRSFLTPFQFEQIIERILREEEHNDATISKVKTQLVKFATNRLVLLSAKVENEIAFDVRSLQEYMAAAQITGGAPVMIIERMRLIASSSYWRHVFRIAASKIFSSVDLSYLREDIIAICHALDAGDFGRDDSYACSGAKLACDLLLDGVGGTSPRLKNNLVRRALVSMDAGSSGIGGKYSSFLTEGTQEIFGQEISTRISQGRTLSAKGAFTLLANLYQNNSQFVDTLLMSSKRYDDKLFLDSFSEIDAKLITNNTRNLLKAAQNRIGAIKTIGFIKESLIASTSRKNATPPKYDDLYTLPAGFLGTYQISGFRTGADKTFKLHTLKNRSAIAIKVISMNNTSLLVPKYPLVEGLLLEQVKHIIEFCRNPNSKTLSEAYACTINSMPAEAADRMGLPWPLHSLINDKIDNDDFRFSLEDISSGKFGEIEDWILAEKRWLTEGISINEIASWASGNYINADIARFGLAVPYGTATMTARIDDEGDLDPKTFFNIISSIESIGKKITAVEIITRAMSTKYMQRNYEWIAEQIVDILPEMSTNNLRVPRILRSISRIDEFWSVPQFVDYVNKKGYEGENTYWTLNFAPIAYAFRRDVSRRGLLYHIAYSAVFGRELGYIGIDTSVLRVIPIDALQEHRGDTDAIKCAVLLLKLYLGVAQDMSPEEAARALISANAQLDPARVRSILEMNFIGVKVKECLRLLIQKINCNDFSSISNIISILDAQIQTTPSLIGSADECIRLNLPKAL